MVYSMEMMLNDHFLFLPDMWLGFSISSLSKCNGRLFFLFLIGPVLKERLSQFGMSYLYHIHYFCTPTPKRNLCYLLFTFSAMHFEFFYIWSLWHFYTSLQYFSIHYFSIFLLYNWHIGGVTWAPGNPYLWIAMHSFLIYSESLKEKVPLFHEQCAECKCKHCDWPSERSEVPPSDIRSQRTT